MPLAAGSRLGPYEIIAPLGAGGMGEVYKARDTRLGRDVAVKVLHGAFAADEDARGRFDREARTISQLNHPNICVLHDLGEQGSTVFLVMEYLEGETLAARIARGPIPPEEALEYAMQIADALDKAHRQGVVHRDLKPANVMLTKAAARTAVTTTLPALSTVKLLDFGLAKLAPPPVVGTQETVLASNIPGAMTQSPGTARGTILGTFQYMSPEQVEAQDVDSRTDIWAFGCVLYEMLTGRRAFEGRTQASMIASILSRDPAPVSELQPLIPPALARVVRVCLAKDPDARFQNAYDLLLQLQWIAEGGSAAGLPAPVVAHRKRRERALWAGVAVLTLAVGALAAWMVKPTPVISNTTERFAYVLPEGQVFTRMGRRYITLSPDGKRLAYIANKQLHLREMHQLAALPIPGTEEDPIDPVFSPDGEWIAYFVPLGDGQGFTLKKIRTSGGTPVPLCHTGQSFGVSWTGHTLVFGQNTDTVHGIQSVPDTAGTPTTLVTVSQDEVASSPQLLTDSGPVLFTVRPRSAGWEDATIVVQAPGEAARTVVVKNASDGRLILGDRLLYISSGDIFGVGFDVRTRTVRGGAAPIIDNVDFTGTGFVGSGAAVLDVAHNGTLVFVPGRGSEVTEARQLVWVDRQGKEELIPAPERAYMHPVLSPEGGRVVFAIESSRQSSLHTWDLDRQVMSRLTPTGDQADVTPRWTTDGKSVVFLRGLPDLTRKIMRVGASGASEPEVLLDLGKTSGLTGYIDSVSPDGKLLLYRVSQGTSSDLVALPLDGPEPKPQPILNTALGETHGTISPDGRWLAYALYEVLGQQQVFVRPYPKVDADRWQASATAGSADLIWARSSRELFYQQNSSGKLMGVTVQPGPVFGRETVILDNAPYMPASNNGTDYDISLDGRRFLMIKRSATSGTTKVRPTITVVTHWLDELKARVK